MAAVPRRESFSKVRQESDRSDSHQPADVWSKFDILLHWVRVAVVAGRVKDEGAVTPCVTSCCVSVTVMLFFSLISSFVFLLTEVCLARRQVRPPPQPGPCLKVNKENSASVWRPPRTGGGAGGLPDQVQEGVRGHPGGQVLGHTKTEVRFCH